MCSAGKQCRNPGCIRGLSLSSLRKAALCGSSLQPAPTVSASQLEEDVSVLDLHTHIHNCQYLKNISYSRYQGVLILEIFNCVVMTFFFKLTELKEQNERQFIDWRDTV